MVAAPAPRINPNAIRIAVAPTACAISPLCAIAASVAITSTGEGRMDGGTSPVAEAACQAASSDTGTTSPTAHPKIRRRFTAILARALW
jgi:hypothetical protein